MKDKRISLRFREDNALESEAWKCLEEYAKRENISKNAALIDLILSGGSKDNSVEEMAEQIADAVAEKLLQLTTEELQIVNDMIDYMNKKK